MKRELRIPDQRAERREPMTLAELQDLHDEIALGYAEFPTSDDRRVVYLYQKIRELLDMKEKFQHVFTTNQGSHYFVIPSGESLRIKPKDSNDPIQPVMKKIIFISDTENSRLLSLKKASQMIGMPLQIQSLMPGVHPLELGIVGTDEPIYEEGNGTLVLKGSKVRDFITGNDINTGFIGGTHLGNKVVDVIKQ